MRCKLPYIENFVVLAKKHAGGNWNLMINFAWPYSTQPESIQTTQPEIPYYYIHAYRYKRPVYTHVQTLNRLSPSMLSQLLTAATSLYIGHYLEPRMRNTKSSLSRADAGGDQKQDYHLEWPKLVHFSKKKINKQIATEIQWLNLVCHNQH